MPAVTAIRPHLTRKPPHPKAADKGIKTLNSSNARHELQASARWGLTRRVLLALIVCLTPVLTVNAAVAPQPHELVSDVVARVMERLAEVGDHDGGEVDGDSNMLALFEEELSPHFAFPTISRWIAGERWQTFSESERAELQAAVHDHIVHAYASLLARGHNVSIVIDDNSKINKKSARVGGLLALPGGQDLSLEFRLLRGEFDWKLYDLTVDGLSFARSLKAELQPILKADGIAGLRAYLQRHQ